MSKQTTLTLEQIDTILTKMSNAIAEIEHRLNALYGDFRGFDNRIRKRFGVFGIRNATAHDRLQNLEHIVSNTASIILKTCDLSRKDRQFLSRLTKQEKD